MNATSSPTLSLALSTETLSRMGPPGRRSQKDCFVPRSATALGNDLGFSAASQRLAQRRSAVSHQGSPLSEAMQSNLAYLLPAGHAVSGYLQGGQSKLMSATPRKMLQYRALAEADLERSQLTVQDQFEAHDLDHLLLSDLAQQLQRYPIGRADLVKKTLRFFPEQPLYVLLVTPVVAQASTIAANTSEFTLGTQIAQELSFSRELLVCLTCQTEPDLIHRIQAQSPGNLLDD